MSALDPFAKLRPADSGEGFCPTQGDMYQMPDDGAAQGWSDRAVAVLVIVFAAIGFAAGGVAGAAIVLGAL